MTVIKFQAGELRRLLSNALLFACKDDTLPALVAVRFDIADGLTVVATNRYVMSFEVALDASIDGSDPFTLPADAARSLIKNLDRRDANEVTVSFDPGTAAIKIETANSSYLFASQFGEFPKWRQLVPSKDSAAEVSSINFNPVHLALLAKVDGGSKDLPASFTFNGPHRPALISVGETFCSLYMPINS